MPKGGCNIVRAVVIVPPSLINFELQKGFALAIAKAREPISGTCPVENVRFLANLLKFNDNSQNRYSDDFLRATYIDAFRLTLTTSTSQPGIDQMPETVKLLYDEVNRAFNMEILKPSYNRVVLVACLRFFCELFCLGYLPFKDATVFNAFTLPGGNSCRVRVTAIVCMVKIITAMASLKGASGLLLSIIKQVMVDPEPQFIREVLKQLAADPPFNFSEYPDRRTLPLNTWLLRKTIWGYMVHPKTEHRVRMLIADLFSVMYQYSDP
uniref:MIF4G domain-containing protein n=1 Tax=Panagrellus redivivus TaxID=6233 RepID=A0A7E4UPS4_PANRE